MPEVQKVRPVLISLSPNTSARDVWAALLMLLSPWRWKKGRRIGDLESAFTDYLPIGHAISFSSGRTSWHMILKALGIGEGDEVLMQALTCVVVPNPVTWCGARPVYVDIDPHTYNMDLDDLEKKITKRSGVLLVQHTFGMPNDMSRIMRIAEKHDLIVVEDCAHALGAKVRNTDGKWQKVGTFGRAAFFSLGRDKVISSVFGGMAVTNDDELAGHLRDFQEVAAYPYPGWIVQQLLHPLLFALIKPLYFRYNLGKILLVLSQKMGLLSKAVYPCEKKGKQHSSMPRRLPNAQAALALGQFKRLDEFNEKRRSLADRYLDGLAANGLVELPQVPDYAEPIFMRFSIQADRAGELIKVARKYDMLLDNWYLPVIAPYGVAAEAVGYQAGDCPIAEKVARRIINLPTYPTMRDSDAERVIGFFNDLD